MKRFAFILGLALLLFPFSLAAEYTINATDDVYIFQWSPDVNTNFGSNSNLNTYNGGSQSQRTFLRFPASAFDACDPQTITASVSLYYHTQDGGGTRYLRIFEADNDAWNEENITWNNNPCDGSLPGVVNGTCNSSYASEVDFTTPNIWKSFGADAIVKKAVFADYSNVSMIIIDRDENDGSGGKQRGMYSKEASSGIYTPYLNVNCTASAQPEITFFNMTSEGGAGCVNWNTNKQNACTTSDTTPTVYFVTGVAANCAIGVSNSNYSTLGASRNCTGGEGTTQHTCTLTSQDELVSESSYVYLGCKGSNNIENATSTSGALALQITGLSSSASSAIGRGVQNALLSGYTNYTSQQIYAVNLAGMQDSGTFDWVAKKGTKTWALNYVSQGESHIGLFNLTPVLYVLEMSNVTNSTITNLVELMINATK